MLKKRLITALFGIPILFAVVWFDGPLPWFSIFAVGWCVLAAIEFYKITSVTKVLSLTCLGLVGTLLLVLSPHFKESYAIPLLLTSLLLLSMILLIFRRQRDGSFAVWAWMIAGMIYVGWLLSYLVALRLEAGREWVFLALFTTFGSDTAAFFVGKWLGKKRLAPGISPAKTWEGAIAGLFGAVAVSIAVVALFRLPLDYGQAVAAGLLIGIMGQFGDLVESLLKRNMDVKESGSLMPGHGGLLDRMDSIAFSGVATYYFFLAFSNGWLSW